MKKYILLLNIIGASLFSTFAHSASLEQKIGQMIMVAFNGTNASDAHVKSVRSELSSGLLGGVIIGGANVQNPNQLKELMEALQQSAAQGQKKSGHKALFSIDQEGGIVARLSHKKGFGQYPRPFDVAQKNDVQQAQATWKNMACELKNYGINFNLAPVVDLNIVPNSPAIGKWGRSFSKHPQKVTKWAEIFIDSQHQCGVLTSLKHFPGHGSALGDTHEGFVDVSRSWSENELKPYKDLIAKGKVDTIMTAHVVNKNISAMPATLSPEFLNGMLRNKLNYKGVIITDDLMMGAIDKYYNFDERLVKSVQAGADILLIAAAKNPEVDNAASARRALLNAVKSGQLSEKDIDNAYQRIVRLKQGL